MSNETVTMLLEILKKLGCSEETMNAVKADPALKTDDAPMEKKEETPEMEEKEEDKSGVAVVVTKEEKPEEESPMKALMKSMLKSK